MVFAASSISMRSIFPVRTTSSIVIVSWLKLYSDSALTLLRKSPLAAMNFGNSAVPRLMRSSLLASSRSAERTFSR